MRSAVGILAISACVLAPAPGARGEQAGRYSLTPVEEGMLRLDSRTGALSLCRRVEGLWACAAVSDGHLDLQHEAERLGRENAGLGAKVARLSRENAELKAKVDRLQAQIEAGRRKTKAPPPPALPDERTIDEMMNVLEKMVRRFQDMIERLKPKQPEKHL